jgi:DNA-binding NarL/FixJ family response regulator
MNRLATLTPREQDILVGVAAGQSNAQLANELSLSEKTVTNTLTMIFHKLGVQSRTEAAVLVLLNSVDGMPLVVRARERAIERLGVPTAGAAT